MQRANYSEHFSSKATISVAIELLSREPRGYEQLCNDIRSNSSSAKNEIKNSINYLIDIHVIVFSDHNKLALKNKSYSKFSNVVDEIILWLSSELLISRISSGLINHYEFGLCLDRARVEKDLIGTLSLYYGFEILGAPIIDRFWPIREIYQSIFLREAETGLEPTWKQSHALSLESLKKKLANQEKAGEEAEIWVLNNEKSRLKTHPFKNKIARISNEFVNAGFDIVSFKSEQSLGFDRFIEVKSFSKSPEFYLTFNEAEKAKLLGSKYILVLVNRSKMCNSDYKPIEIINPYNVLLTGDLPENITIKAETWKITLSNNEST